MRASGHQQATKEDPMTMDPDTLEVAQIEQQIAALEHRKAQLRTQAQAAWPKPFRVTLQASRETMQAIGLELGYTGEALTVFAFFGYEVEAQGLAEQNGQAQLVEVAGRRLVPREEA
jgi:hypothetical protein